MGKFLLRILYELAFRSPETGIEICLVMLIEKGEVILEATVMNLNNVLYMLSLVMYNGPDPRKYMSFRRTFVVGLFKIHEIALS